MLIVTIYLIKATKLKKKYWVKLYLLFKNYLILLYHKAYIIIIEQY